jgi:hypothetical protein
MGMRIIWGLWDSEAAAPYLMALFEAENLLVAYRDQLLRKWYDEQTVALPEDQLGATDPATEEYERNRQVLLDYGYDRWRIDQINNRYPRFITVKYELWNSVPPNPERLIVHFDT